MGATRQPGEDVLVRYLSDSLRLVEGVLRKNSPGDIKVSDLQFFMGPKKPAVHPCMGLKTWAWASVHQHNLLFINAFRSPLLSLQQQGRMPNKRL